MWEITSEDVGDVLEAHGLSFSDEQLNELLLKLDQDVIFKGLEYYTNMEDQTSSMLEDIEIQLMDMKILFGDKKFAMSDTP